MTTGGEAAPPQLNGEGLRCDVGHDESVSAGPSKRRNARPCFNPGRHFRHEVPHAGAADRDGRGAPLNYVETMVIPGIPTIQADFGTTSTVASWITSAFLIVGSAVAPLFGKLGDTHGKKRMVSFARFLHLRGVGIAGFSPSIYFLLLSRAVQGVGFAIVPLSLAIITDTFPKEKIAAAQGVISGTFAIGAAAGLIMGPYVVQDLGWQYAFHSAFVLSIVLAIIVWRVIKPDVPGPSRSVDFAGASILMSGVTLLLVYATEGPSLGWFVPEELAFLVPGLVLSILFFFFERTRLRAAHRPRPPPHKERAGLEPDRDSLWDPHVPPLLRGGLLCPGPPVPSGSASGSLRRV